MTQPDITITLTPGQADQALRALAGRKRQFRNTLSPEEFGDLLTAQQQVLRGLQFQEMTDAAEALDAPVQEPVVSTRKRRTPAKKED